MVKAVILDSGPLGLLCHASPPPQALVCQRWAADLKAAGHRVLIPESTPT